MRRCTGCGAFYKGDVCPNTEYHEQDHVDPPPLPPIDNDSLIGTPAWCDWPGQGRVPCLIASDPDEDGVVGLMILSGNIRRNLDDLHMTGDE